MKRDLFKIGLGLSILCAVVWFGCQAHNMSGIETPRDVEQELYEEEESEGPTRIVINVPARELTLYRKNKVVFKFPVAVGARGFKTPIGDRSLSRIVWNPWWIPPKSPWAAGEKPRKPGPGNPLGLVKMILGQAILLHGTSNERSVGHAVSHGCMRMYNNDAKTIAWWIQKNFTDKDDTAYLDEYRRNGSQSFYVTLDTPIPVEIEYDAFKIADGQFESHPDIYGKLGNRKGKAYEELASAGFPRQQINDVALDRILALSINQTARITMKELIPGKLMASSKRIPDPVDQAWRKKNI